MRSRALLNITWRCQLPCSYCWVRRHVNRIPELTNVPERPLEDWIAAIRRDPAEVIDIGGGEPLSVPWCLDLIAEFPDIQWGLSTNGLNSDQVQDLARRSLRQIVNINYSYHPEAGQRYAWYNALWKRQVLMLRDAGYPVGPNLEITPFNMEHGQWAIDWLASEGLHMVVSPLCGGREELQRPQPIALTCKGGENFITVAPDGQAWPCLSSLNSYAWRETSIGNWLDGTIDLSKVPNPCHLWCVEYLVQYDQHESGDFWDLRVKPMEGVHA